MRIVRYNVAATLDGFIAGPRGEFDWIPDDPTVDFAGLFAGIDTVLIGRKTFELVLQHPEQAWPAGSRVFVFSRTLDPARHPDVTVIATDPVPVVAALRAEEGKGEIWLFGGGELFGTLLRAGQVDSVEVTVVPVLLGAGVPLLAGAARTPLRLVHTQRYPSGMIALHYDVPGAAR